MLTYCMLVYVYYMLYDYMLQIRPYGSPADCPDPQAHTWQESWRALEEPSVKWQDCVVWHGVAWHGMVQRGAAWYGVAGCNLTHST